MFQKRFLSMVLLVLAGTMSVLAQLEMTLPQDTAVKMGRLENGLTYYIRYNNWPEHRAEFYIAQRVGSLQENDQQRGLAHFLEHMCFNGTTHFPGNGVIRWCESVGIQFGQDLNAYTSIDETVYNISNVPTQRQTALDSCLLILHDWSHDLLLEPEEIDKERGVIHEEWRMRSSAQQRMLERALPKLYPGSKYGHRMPIGLMEIIDNFKPQFLRDYYEKWYRPDNQAIIVVGDVDVKHVEAKIKELFNNIKLPENAAQVEKEPVPDTPEPIYVIEKDREQQNTQVMLMMKHDVYPEDQKNTVGYLLHNYLRSTAIGMLNARLAEMTEKADCPFVGAQVGDGNYLFAKTKDAFELAAIPKDGQLEASLRTVLTEARRAARFGFTETEYQRTKDNVLSGLEASWNNREKRTSQRFVGECQSNYLNNSPIIPLEFYYENMKQLVPVLPLEAVNKAMAELVSESDSNMVCLVFCNEKEGNVYPTEESLSKAIAEARSAQLDSYVDNVKQEPLLPVLPKPGKIKKESKSKKFDYTEMTLSNGIKVILKQTDFNKESVSLSAEGFGGSSLYGEKDYVNLQVFDDVIEASGLGAFSNTELRKALAGKIAGASMSMGGTRQYIHGSSTPKYMETMFQLVYLYFTHIAKDQKSFESILRNYEIELKNAHLSPDKAFSDSVSYTVNRHNPRSRSLELDDLKKIDYDRILEIARERTANAGAYKFTIIGNFQLDSIRPLLERYIASLPVQKKVQKGHNISTFAYGKVNNFFRRKMETPKATAVMIWASEDIPYTLENSVRASMAGQVLSMVYLKKIREDASAAYSVSASCGIQHNDFYTRAMMSAQCPMKPEKADVALSIMREEMDSLAIHCDGEMLKKVQEYMLKQADTALKDNGYWSGIITLYDRYGLDFHTDYKSVIAAQRPEDICAFVKQLLKAGNHIEVVMQPEEEVSE